MVDIFELLQRDHRELVELLDRLSRPPGQADFDGTSRAYLLDRLVAVGSRHEAGEEMVFWPQVRKRLDDGDELADAALAQEGDAKALLDLLRFTTAEAELAVRCGEAAEAIRAHAAFEESVVWPRMRKATTFVWSAITAAKFLGARRAGPTRPHPNGPDRPLLLATLGAPAVMMDHARDILGRRRGISTLADVPSEAPDAVAVLTGDHLRIGRLLSDAEQQDDPDDATVAEAIRELSIHDAVERRYLYPLLRERLDDGGELHEHAIAEHGHIARLGADVLAYPVHDGARRGMIAELIAAARSHIEEEERGPLPRLAAHLSREELVELGRLLEAARSKAPTRPHPHSGGSGFGARVTGTLALPIDRARDALSGRGRK